MRDAAHNKSDMYIPEENPMIPHSSFDGFRGEFLFSSIPLPLPPVEEGECVCTVVICISSQFSLPPFGDRGRGGDRSIVANARS